MVELDCKGESIDRLTVKYCTRQSSVFSSLHPGTSPGHIVLFARCTPGTLGYTRSEIWGVHHWNPNNHDERCRDNHSTEQEQKARRNERDRAQRTKKREATELAAEQKKRKEQLLLPTRTNASTCIGRSESSNNNKQQQTRTKSTATGAMELPLFIYQRLTESKKSNYACNGTQRHR